MKRYLLAFVLVIAVLSSSPIEAEEISAKSLLADVISQLEQVEDFKGTIVSKLYLGEEVIDYRTQVMKSKTRFMSNNLSDNSQLESEENKLLNSIPWIYLPPNYNILKNSLPLEGQLDYQEPLDKLSNLYNVELLGESIDGEREVYIIQLENMLAMQRIFVDKEYKTISKIEIFNGANIRLATINYRDISLFDSNIWLPAKIVVSDGRGRLLMEVIYQNWGINVGLTEFDFAKGFDTDYQTKIKQLKEKIKEQRDNDKLHWLLSDLYVKDGNLEEAVNSLQNAIRTKDSIEYRKKLVEIYQMQGKYREALGEVRVALQSAYNDAELNYLLGEVQLQLGRIDNARHSLEKAVDLDPKNTLYLEKLFWVYSNLAEESGKYMLERAEGVAEKLVKLEPKNKSYRIYLADIYLEKGEEFKAYQVYSKAVELAPEDTWVYIKLAQFYDKIDKDNKAEELYEYIVYLDDSLENQRRLADFYFEEGKYELALKEYKVLQSRSAGNLNLKFKVAESYLATGDRERGLDIFNKILEENSFGEFYLQIGDIVKQYDLDSAIDIYHSALKKEGLLTDEEIEEIYRRLGYIYFEEEDQKKLNKLDQLLEIDSQMKIYQLLGKYKFSAGDLEKAISYFKLALDRQDNVENHYNLALAYLMVDHLDLARQEAEKIAEIEEGTIGAEILELIDRVSSLQKEYKDIYVPGRINRIKGDRLRQQGKLIEALFRYRESIFENYDYKLPYFYVGLISAIREDNLQLEMAKSVLEGEELKLLKDLLIHIEDMNRF
ncbi:hypothetical protein U472_04225 [Orenia metallireducens]|uniref:Tetratricopeptide repeat-containing protein n=1 Tax=Orenia metallireducens TaxID=1413210 RepID=A0A1C0ABK7_9FIRM|nr:tetratricopeptide repeat protein [Orenia metallireducens]OCL27765.1 hypothetical protein U472_04225 [Orenia metallireducens]